MCRCGQTFPLSVNFNLHHIFFKRDKCSFYIKQTDIITSAISHQKGYCTILLRNNVNVYLMKLFYLLCKTRTFLTKVKVNACRAFCCVLKRGNGCHCQISESLEVNWQHFVALFYQNSLPC